MIYGNMNLDFLIRLDAQSFMNIDLSDENFEMWIPEFH